MKERGLLTLLCALIGLCGPASAQGTFGEVYKVFQNNCTFSSCHDNDSPMLGLDLQGAGLDAMMEVYDNIVGVEPANFHAAQEGYDYIAPGRPELSFIFRKAHNGLDPTIELHPDEGGTMPKFGDPLSEREAEIIRQWILYGAPFSGDVVDTSLIFDYYENNGIASVPAPPAPPAANEGFQMHLGPFFIPPGEEDEVFLKFDPMLDADTEVKAVEVFMGDQSHHFILYKFFSEGQEFCNGNIPTSGLGADQFDEGFRPVDEASHTSAFFQVGAQNTERVDLPYKTAFYWADSVILDLNSHYINSNQQHVLGAEVYVNVYTQPVGTAEEEMQSIMIPNTDLDIPNTGEEITFQQSIPVGFCYPNGIYLWATTSHTHQLGQDYDIYKTDIAGNVIDHFYDASCFTDGVPGCQTEFYDYQHPPTRVFENYYGLAGTDWIRHEASYINDGPEDVGWGFTSEDEMMLFFFFFVEDTTGLSPPVNAVPAAMDDTASTLAGSFVTIDVLDNDSDPDGTLDQTSVAVVSGPSNGNVTVEADGSLTYEPDPGFSGIDMFTYVVCDNGEPPLCDTAEVTVTVQQVSSVLEDVFPGVRTWPNPVSDQLFLSDPNSVIEIAELMTLHGQSVAAISRSGPETHWTVDFAALGLEDGIYFLVLEDAEGRRSASKVVCRSIR